MSYFTEALAHDAAREYEQAAACYEAAIRQPAAPVDAFANLSFIYWEALTQQAFSGGTPIPLSLQQRSWSGCITVLDAGLQRYPLDLELSFLQRYYPYRGFGDEFSEADCRLLLADCADHNQTILPRFFLSISIRRDPAELAALLTECSRQPTAKYRWVTSILRSSLARDWE